MKMEELGELDGPRCLHLHGDFWCGPRTKLPDVGAPITEQRVI